MITIATKGDATNFGDLVVARRGFGGLASPTRGIFFGGAASTTRGVFFGGTYPAVKYNIDFVTFSTTGDATDFGDLLSATYYNAATSNGIRTVWVGNTGITNTMEYVTIATTGNSVDWGDQGGTTQHSGGACSDSHGGI